ncbi:hypothetical protein [Paraburkholderia sp. BCC1885]|uniref:hypothetical protein n=1 Tax=Paraburkholderia sp. BCC1885 TaxID=2562669 RepID=UPI00118396F0|nr:hypothetical protein [Paraburkholderia sp. BCC1885]
MRDRLLNKLFSLLALVVIILVAMALCGRERFWDTMVNGEHEASLYNVQACSDALHCNTPALLIQGEILSGVLFIGIRERVSKWLNDHPKVNTICFDSSGGDVSQSIRLADLIFDRGLNTCVTQLVRHEGRLTYLAASCHSACVIPLAAGLERTAFQPDIGLLLHGDSMGGLRLSDIRNEYVKLSYRPRAQNIADLTEVIRTNPFERPKMLSVSDLKQTYDLFTVILDAHILKDAPLCSALSNCVRNHGPECSTEQSGQTYQLPPQGMMHYPECLETDWTSAARK